MKRLFKRIISSVIVSITVLNILLPIIPEGILDINAAYIGHTDDTGETMYTFSSKLKDFNLKTTKSQEFIDELSFNGDTDTVCSRINKFDGGAAELDFKSKVLGVINSVPVKGASDTFNFNDYIDKIDTTIINRFTSKMKYTSFNDAWGAISDDTKLITGVIDGMERTDEYFMIGMHAVGYDESTGIYYYFSAALFDAQLDIGVNWDTFTFSVYSSNYLLDLKINIYDEHLDANNWVTLPANTPYKYKDLSGKVNLSDEDLETISSDIKNGKFTNLPVYDYIDSITSNYTDSGTLADHHYVFGTKAAVMLNLDYTNGTKDGHDGFRSNITCINEFNDFEDMKLSDAPEGYLFEMSNAYIDFGESTAMCNTNTSNSTQVQNIANQLANIIQGICQVDMPNDKWANNAEIYADALASAYPSSILVEVLAFMDAMQKAQELWMIDGAGEDITVTELECPELKLPGDEYEIMTKVLSYNISCTAAKKAINKNFEMVIDNGTYRIKLNFGDDNLGTANSNLTEVWKGLSTTEKIQLAYSFNSLHELRFKGNNCTNDWPEIDYTVEVSNAGVYTPDIATELAVYPQMNIESIQSVIEKRDDSVTNTRSVYNVARNANCLGQYILGVSLYSEASSEEDIGLYSIYDATLQSMYHLDYEWEGTNESYFPFYCLNNLGILSEETSNVPLYIILTADGMEDLEMFLQYLYNLTYAFDVAAFSEGAKSKSYTPEDIRKALEGDTSADSTLKELLHCFTEQTNFKNWKSAGNMNVISEFDDVANYDFSVGMIRSIIELHDFCEFLELLNTNGELKAGITWTPSIQEYLKLYKEYEDIFNAFRNNEHIYAQAPKGRKTDEEPLGEFFNIENQQLTDNWIKGFSLSSQFVPMETNLYDANSITIIEDEDWISDFYYKYAFFRKALYINTDNSALVNEFISNEESTTRVCTLRDLLNYDRDIILTLDDNFYNADDISDAIRTLDYTSLRQNTNAQEEQTGEEKVVDWVKGAFALSPEQILKTNNEMYYSDTIATNCTKLGADEPEKWNVIENAINAYILTQDDIIGENSALDDYEYSVRQSYAVVSAIYRSASLYNETLKSIVSDNAIFKSSKSICYTPGTGKRDWLALYNYYMLANLEEQMKNDAASTLDLDAPIFCDIFGNIITESGLVIIPAAANATLCGEKWNPYTIGWSEYYNNGNRIKGGQFSDDVYSWLLGYDYSQSEVDENGQIILSSTERVKEAGGGYFELDRSGDLILRTTSLTSNGLSAIIQWDTLNKNSTIIQQLFFNNAYFDKGKDLYGLNIVNLVVETLRGAPIEHIDYMFEGLDGNMNISKYGVYMAYKLEELTDSLVSGTNGNEIGGNSIVTMPNLAFMSGVEYIVLYAFKIVFAVCVVGFAISLYMDSVVNSLGIKSVGKFVITLLCVIAALTLVPNLMNWSYYKANKDILSSEVGYIMMLNYCKEFDGSEIGITSVKTPETQTELYLKVDDISVDWWDILDDVLFKNTFQTVSELYADQMDNNAMQGLPGVKTKGDGLYIDIQDVYNSTNLNYLPSTNVLKNTVYGSGSKLGSVDTVASFTVPYYVILEQLVANINEYNVQRDITAYSYSVGANGSVLTYDIIAPYLKSNEFLSDGYDIMGLDRVLNLDNHRLCYNFAFNQSDIEQMKLPQWYPTEMYTENMRAESVNRIYDKARTYVAENAELIGKVPDEVFLKVMAMQMAIEFNREFNAPYGRSIEIMNIDTRDLARFMVSDRASMYKYFSYGYARYTYEEAGSLGVIFAGMFIAVLWITSFVKPMLIIFIIGIFTINVVFRKLLFRKESKAFEGYLIGCACLCLVNYAYAGMLKVSLNIANTGLGSITALACALIIQIVYIATLIGIAKIVVKDWQNNGYGEFLNIGSGIIANVNHTNRMIVDKLVSRSNHAYADTSSSRRYSGGDVDIETIDDMLDRDAEREERGTFSPA